MSSNQANAANSKSADEKIRAFVGFRMSAEVARAIAAFVAHLKPRVPGDGITWVYPHNIHLTLRFLGDAIGLHMITPLIEVLKAVAAGIQPFPIRAQGVGVFPNSQRPQIV